MDLPLVRRRLGWWPGVEVVDWRDLGSSLFADRFGSLLRFADREPMGRKLTAIVASALEGPTLYSDVDFLWFRYPPSLDTLLARPRPVLAMSRDYQPTYDTQLVPRVLDQLAAPPFYCAGLLFAHGDFLAECDVASLLEHAATHGSGVTEQTILAEANRQLGGASWPVDEIALNVDDQASLGPSYRHRPWAARHYVGGVRHIFWRDAVALRAGVGP
jgi:hypothetical protein